MPDQEYEVTFLKRMGEEHLFIYYVSEDTAIVPEEDIPMQQNVQCSRFLLILTQLGHSFLPNDSEFGDVKSALKFQERIYMDIDYITIMENAEESESSQSFAWRKIMLFLWNTQSKESLIEKEESIMDENP
ncbi:hypothetical protein JTB14_000029 [Gonioctena quinquepunctata]|nr:hypothetical protein JTB14_000029 [Gonioctena quinquepunctata]